MGKIESREKCLGEMAGGVDDGTSHVAATWHSLSGNSEYSLGECGSPRWWASALLFSEQYGAENSDEGMAQGCRRYSDRDTRIQQNQKL